MFKPIQLFNARATFNAPEIAGAASGVDTSAITDAANERAATSIAVAVASIEAGAIMDPAKAASQTAGK